MEEEEKINNIKEEWEKIRIKQSEVNTRFGRLISSLEWQIKSYNNSKKETDI